MKQNFRIEATEKVESHLMPFFAVVDDNQIIGVFEDETYAEELVVGTERRIFEISEFEDVSKP